MALTAYNPEAAGEYGCGIVDDDTIACFGEDPGICVGGSFGAARWAQGSVFRAGTLRALGVGVEARPLELVHVNVYMRRRWLYGELCAPA